MVRAGAANDWVNLGGCQTLSVLVILFVILRIYVPDGSVREALGIRALAGWQFVLSVGLGVGLYPSMAMLDREILKRFPYDAEELAQFERLATVHTISERVVFIAIAFCVLPSRARSSSAAFCLNRSQSRRRFALRSWLPLPFLPFRSISERFRQSSFWASRWVDCGHRRALCSPDRRRDCVLGRSRGSYRGRDESERRYHVPHSVCCRRGRGSAPRACSRG